MKARFRRRSGRLWCSQVRFNRVSEIGRLWEGSGKVLEKVPESLGAKPSEVQRVPEKVPALGFAAHSRKTCSL